jgi:hypothetical protein
MTNIIRVFCLVLMISACAPNTKRLQQDGSARTDPRGQSVSLGKGLAVGALAAIALGLIHATVIGRNSNDPLYRKSCYNILLNNTCVCKRNTCLGSDCV